MHLLVALAMVHQVAPADLIVENGRIWTDGHLTASTSVAIRAGRFVALGKSLAEYVGPKTQRIDAKGNWIVPGLIDSHTHIAESCADFAFGLDLRPAKSRDEFVALVKEKAARLGPNDWIRGGGWSVESYPSKEAPTKAWIDAVSGDRPAALTRMDGHSMLVNSKALAKAGITKDGPPDPKGGRIERDPVTNEPTGLLADTAMGLIPLASQSRDLVDRALPIAIAEAHRYGVTGAHDIVSPIFSTVWQRYMKREDRAFRVALYFRGGSERDVSLAKQFSGTPGWLEARGLKLYMDGSMGSRSAYMAAPFTTPLATQPKDWRGLPYPGATTGLYAKIIQAAARENIQIMTHAIGDQANHDLLDIYAGVPSIRTKRFRVEHAQHLLPSDIARFGKLGVIASMQPYHKFDDGRYAETVIGTERSRSSYAFHDLLRTKGQLAFGSDFDVVTINPWVGIATAVTGRIATGKVWMPQQNITLDQALDAYTRGAARAAFMENQIGRIAPNFHADFVILDRKLKRDGSNAADVKPVSVYVEGRLVNRSAPPNE